MNINIKIENNDISVDRNIFQEAIKQLTYDEILDVLNDDNYYMKGIINRMLNEHQEYFCGLLHLFFNHKSDTNEFLTAEQQEKIEEDFSDWILYKKIELSE